MFSVGKEPKLGVGLANVLGLAHADYCLCFCKFYESK